MQKGILRKFQITVVNKLIINSRKQLMTCNNKKVENKYNSAFFQKVKEKVKVKLFLQEVEQVKMKIKNL